MENWVCEYGKPDMAAGVAHVSTAPGMYGDIATVWNVHGNAEEVGALLSAAPDLLEVLRLFVRSEKMARDGNPPQDADELIKLGEVAIAKAEGKS